MASLRTAFLICLCLALAGLAAGCSARGIEALRILQDIAAGPAPSPYKESRPPPLRRAVAYRRRGIGYAGDLYRPGGGVAPAAALVLVPGAAPAGKDDPRLIAFAETWARARFLVLVPDLPNLRAQQVRPGDIAHIADAIAHLANHPERPRDGLLGVAAISYAVGPAILAALGDEARDRVGFVLGVGGYHDLGELVTFFTTGHFRAGPGAPWRTMIPNVYGKWVFVAANAERLDDPHDRWALAEIARRKRRDPEADIAELSAGLGPEGRAVGALLENTDPARVPALIAALPAGIRADLAALDLARRDLAELRARLILVHGRDDSIIPYTESQRLAAAAPAGRAELFLVDSLAHVDLGVAGIADTLTLWDAIVRVLEQRDRAGGA